MADLVAVHTAPNRDGLLLPVDILPRQNEYLTDAQSGVTGDLDREQGRVALSLQMVRQ